MFKRLRAVARNTNTERILKSPFLSTLAILVVVEFALIIVNPLQFIKDVNYLPFSRNPLLGKITNYLENDKNPSVIVLGSSLPMMAIANCDSAQYKSLDSQDYIEILEYNEAKYLTQKLNESKNNIAVRNLTIAASMVSDTRMLVDELIKSGKSPKVIVYGIGPRSFIDNSILKKDKTPIYRLFSEKRRLSNFVQIDSSTEIRRDALISYFWNYYNSRLDYKNFFFGYTKKSLQNCPLTSEVFVKAKSLQSNAISKSYTKTLEKKYSYCLSQDALKEHKNAKNFVHDLAVYDYRYNPPDFKQFDYQMSCLQNLIKNCKKADIEILIVSMPITKQNRNLINEKLLEKYLVKLPELTKNCGGTYIDLNSEDNYRLSDFMDSVHTNANGGRKVQKRIAESLLKQDWL